MIRVATIVVSVVLLIVVVAGVPFVAPATTIASMRPWSQRSAASVSTFVRQESVVSSSDYLYVAQPSISCDFYAQIYQHFDSPAAPEANAICEMLVADGFDPVVHAAQAMHETRLGTGGIGLPEWKNMHGVQCHDGDGRISDSAVPWGNGCAGVYASYKDAVATWMRLIKREYVAYGLTTPDAAVWKYAPPGADGNDPPSYIGDMHNWIKCWRSGQFECK